MTKQGESKCVPEEEKDDVPERRVHKASRLEDDDSDEKLAGDETIEEMVRRMNRELDEEFEDFNLKGAVVDNIITTAENPTKAAMAANTATATAATTVASSTAIGGAGRTPAEAAADAKRASKAEPLPLVPPPELATPSLPPPGTPSGFENESAVKTIKYYANKFHDRKQQIKGAGDQWMTMAAAPPAPTRAAMAAATMEAASASAAYTIQNVCLKAMQVARGRRTPRTRDKRVRLDPGLD